MAEFGRDQAPRPRLQPSTCDNSGFQCRTVGVIANMTSVAATSGASIRLIRPVSAGSPLAAEGVARQQVQSPARSPGAGISKRRSCACFRAQRAGRRPAALTRRLRTRSKQSEIYESRILSLELTYDAEYLVVNAPPPSESVMWIGCGRGQCAFASWFAATRRFGVGVSG